MSIFNMVGCGGSSLNYEVVGGTSAPSGTSENTIWINTSTDITSHIFSATEPENPVADMVWIFVGASSPVAFPATEENPIIVYPLSAKQYVGGAWVDKTAKTYQNGAWVDWLQYLFKDGDTFDNITGGWERKNYQGNSKGTFTISDCLKLDSSNTSLTVCAGLKDFNPSSLGKYTELVAVVEFTVAGSAPGARIGIVPDYSLGSSGIDNKWTAKATVNASGTSTMTLDISNIDIGYPMVSSFNGLAEFKEIWLK